MPLPLCLHDYGGGMRLTDGTASTASTRDGRSGFESFWPRARRARRPSRRVRYTATDVFLPHPIYAAQGWVSILNPAEQTSTQLRSLIDDACSLAARRHARKRNAR